MLECIAFSLSRIFPTGSEPRSPTLQVGFFTTWVTRSQEPLGAAYPFFNGSSSGIRQGLLLHCRWVLFLQAIREPPKIHPPTCPRVQKNIFVTCQIRNQISSFMIPPEDSAPPRGLSAPSLPWPSRLQELVFACGRCVLFTSASLTTPLESSKIPLISSSPNTQQVSHKQNNAIWFFKPSISFCYLEILWSLKASLEQPEMIELPSILKVPNPFFPCSS